MPKKLVFGIKESLSQAKKDKLAKLVLSKNIPPQKYLEIELVAKTLGFVIEKSTKTSEELGIENKKSFPVLAVGHLK